MMPSGKDRIERLFWYLYSHPDEYEEYERRRRRREAARRRAIERNRRRR
jgi:hypothetical protein